MRLVRWGDVWDFWGGEAQSELEPVPIAPSTAGRITKKASHTSGRRLRFLARPAF
jgi:hypothetical protein